MHLDHFYTSRGFLFPIKYSFLKYCKCNNAWWNSQVLKHILTHCLLHSKLITLDQGVVLTSTVHRVIPAWESTLLFHDGFISLPSEKSKSVIGGIWSGREGWDRGWEGGVRKRDRKEEQRRDYERQRRGYKGVKEEHEYHSCVPVMILWSLTRQHTELWWHNSTIYSTWKSMWHRVFYASQAI